MHAARQGSAENTGDQGADKGKKNDQLIHGRLALHEVYVFNRNRAAIAKIDDENGEPDRRFTGSDGEHQKSEHLTHEIAKERGKSNQVDVDGEQDQLDRHQNDDDVLAIEKNSENADGEENRGKGEVVAKADRHSQTPLTSDALPRPNLANFNGGGGPPRHLGGNILTLYTLLMAKCQHDCADHGHQQNETRSLKEIHIFGIEDLAQCLGVGETVKCRGGRGDDASGIGRDDPGAERQQQLHQENEADGAAYGQVIEHSLA